MNTAGVLAEWCAVVCFYSMSAVKGLICLLFSRPYC